MMLIVLLWLIGEDGYHLDMQALEQQATLLGLKFDRRTSDRRLLERINEAMKGA